MAKIANERKAERALEPPFQVDAGTSADSSGDDEEYSEEECYNPQKGRGHSWAERFCEDEGWEYGIDVIQDGDDFVGFRD